MKAEHAFTARECFALSMDRMYRVYVSGGELFFIKIGGQPGLGHAVAVQFGLVGALVHRWLEKRAKARLAEELSALDRRDLRSLVPRDKANYRWRVGEIQGSTIDTTTSKLGAHGARVGKWELKTGDGTTHNLQFEDAGEMETAIDALQSLLGGLLRVEGR